MFVCLLVGLAPLCMSLTALPGESTSAHFDIEITPSSHASSRVDRRIRLSLSLSLALSLSLPLSLSVSLSLSLSLSLIHIYIYICIERERERERLLYLRSYATLRS